MAVYVSNLVINTGTTFSQTFNLEATENNAAFDLTGFTATAQMRKHAGSSSKVDFDATIPVPSDGKIMLELSAGDTSNIKSGRYVYDIIVTKGVSKTTVVEGNVLVREGVTR